jgi:hypothetical protein
MDRCWAAHGSNMAPGRARTGSRETRKSGLVTPTEAGPSSPAGPWQLAQTGHGSLVDSSGRSHAVGHQAGPPVYLPLINCPADRQRGLKHHALLLLPSSRSARFSELKPALRMALRQTQMEWVVTDAEGRQAHAKELATKTLEKFSWDDKSLQSLAFRYVLDKAREWAGDYVSTPEGGVYPVLHTPGEVGLAGPVVRMLGGEPYQIPERLSRSELYALRSQNVWVEGPGDANKLAQGRMGTVVRLMRDLRVEAAARSG